MSVIQTSENIVTNGFGKVRFDAEDFQKMISVGILPNAEVRFDVEDFYKMMEAGILPEDNTTEIIDGELIKIMPSGSRHSGIVNKLNRILGLYTGETKIISVQNPVRLNRHYEPQPDIAVLEFREDFYTESHPIPSEILLLIEVSDSTLAFDKKKKVGYYAEAEIPEVWLVNLVEDVIQVFTQPENGNYQRNKGTFRRGETMQSPTIENLQIEVNRILGSQN